MDEKVREKARNAIKTILEAAGYEVGMLEDPYDLASRGDEFVIVLCSDDPGEIAEFANGNFRLMSGGEEIMYRKLLFSPDSGTRADGCIAWGRDEFIRLYGEVALANVLSRPFSLAIDAGEREKDTGMAVPPTGEVEAEEEEETGVIIPHLPIRIKKDSAVRIAKTQGTVTLKFMPFWLYSYRSSGEQVYKDHRVPFDAEGEGGLNAINGLKFEMDAKSVVEGGIPAGAEVIPPASRRRRPGRRSPLM